MNQPAELSEDAALQIHRFTAHDLDVGNPVFSMVSRCVGIENKGKLTRLLIVILVSIIGLAYVTLREGRFFLGSLTITLDGYGDAQGMSFMGDTMVWPFIFLVPIAFILTRVALNRSASMINYTSLSAEEGWLTDTSKYGYRNSIRTALAIFQGRRGWKSAAISTSAWIVAGVFVLYNALTCAFYNELGETYYPYKSALIKVLPSGATKPTKLGPDQTLPAYIQLEAEVLLPKWDTNRHDAPWSTWMARIWVVIFYGLPPFILAKLVTIVWGTSSFLLHKTRWDETSPSSDSTHMLTLPPSSDDKYGGLGHMVSAAMSYLYSGSIFILMITMVFLKEGVPPSWHNYILLVAFTPISVSAFLIPLLITRRSIRSCKSRCMSTLNDEIRKVTRSILHDSQNAVFQGNVDLRLASFESMRSRVLAIPDLPITFSTLARIGLAVGGPFALTLLDHLISAGL